MFDHDNQTAAAAAPVNDENAATNQESAGQAVQQVASQETAKETSAAATEATSHQTSPEAGHAIPAASSEAEKSEAHTQAEAHSATKAADAEASSDADEAAGSEEMSKLMEQYDEKQEAAASKEVIEVTVVAYTS